MFTAASLGPAKAGVASDTRLCSPSPSRKADLDQSDGEEDFYYTELDVNVDSLTDGLSSLTPVSPTSSVPPAFPVPEVQTAPPLLVKPEVSLVSPLSHSAPTNLCHVQTDHAYQVSCMGRDGLGVGGRGWEVKGKTPWGIAQISARLPPALVLARRGSWAGSVFHVLLEPQTLLGKLQ